MFVKCFQVTGSGLDVDGYVNKSPEKLLALVRKYYESNTDIFRFI